MNGVVPTLDVLLDQINYTFLLNLAITYIICDSSDGIVTLRYYKVMVSCLE